MLQKSSIHTYEQQIFRPSNQSLVNDLKPNATIGHEKILLHLPEASPNYNEAALNNLIFFMYTSPILVQ
jgi:hypothetical protein